MLPISLRFVSCDVMSYQSQLAAFKEASKAAPLDHVIANAATAGHWFTGPPFDLEPGTTEPEEPQLGSIRSALIGSYYTTYLACYFLVGAMAGPQLNGAEKWSHQQPSRHATSRAKSLLLIGSIGSYARVAGRPDYAAAKAGVRSIFKNIRTAIGQQTGLRINMLAPGYIKTAMNEKVVPRIEAQGFRFIEMHHAVDAVLRLLSDQQIHGRSIAIGPDGPHDMRDDPEGRDGGDELHKMFQSGEIPTTAAV